MTLFSIFVFAVSLLTQNTDGQGFILVQNTLTWQDAQNHCQAQYGTNLATLKTNEEIAAAMSLRTSRLGSGAQIWVGLNDINVEGKWEWVSGEPCDDSVAVSPTGATDCSIHWAANEPNNLGDEDCAVLRGGTPSVDEAWNDGGCNAQLNFFCDSKYIIVPDQTLTYANAQAHCNTQYGTQLATTITDADVRAAMDQRNGAGFGNNDFWIGLNDLVNNGVWLWDSGVSCDYAPSGDCVNDPHWNNGEPNGGFNVHCGLIRPGENNPANAYDDGGCFNTFRFFCDQPTAEICGVNTFNWDTLTDTAQDKPFAEASFGIDGLTLDIIVELDYVGKTTADSGLTPEYGTTYVLDFEDFEAHRDAINLPGTCQNRITSSFNGKNFNEYWDYPTSNANLLGSNDYLAYPPPGNFWDININPNDCDRIIYSGSFTWNDLTDCKKNGGVGNSYTQIFQDDRWINLTGTFYTNVVSPLWYNSNEGGFYRVYQLISKPFIIAVSKSVYVSGSTGINVFTISVIAVYKEDFENTFKLVVLTESQEYLKLIRDENSIGYVAGTTNNLDANSFSTGLTSETSATTGECLSNKAYLCSQLWKITYDNVKCNGVDFIDFTGDYTLSFTPQCRDASTNIDGTANNYCQDWLDRHTDIRDNLALTTHLTWTDTICDPEIFIVQFVSNMKFYKDNYNAGNEVTIGTPGDTHLFKVGIDRVYVQILTTFPSQTMNVFDSKIINVWICTFKPEYSIEAINENSATGGCFDTNRDGGEIVDNPYFYHIYQIGNNPGDPPIIEAEDYNNEGHPATNDLRFSFIVPHEIARDSLYVHVQIEVTLSTGVRRRLLASLNPTANQMQHTIKHMGVTDKIINKEPQIPKTEPKPQPQEPYNNYYKPQPQEPSPNNYQPPQIPPQEPSSFVLSLSSPWVIGIGSLLSIILALNVILMCYSHCCKNNNNNNGGRVSFINRRGRRNNKYSKVKQIDSEDIDSEAQAINVASE